MAQEQKPATEARPNPGATATKQKKESKPMDPVVREMWIVGGKLALITAVCAIVLGLVNGITAPVIVENRARALAEALAQVSGGNAVGEAVVVEGRDMVQIAYPFAQSNGAVLQLEGNGYGGPMTILAGYEADGQVIDVRLLANEETPGLGKLAEDPSYMARFAGRGGNGDDVPTTKGELRPGEADALSGATITFVGIANAVRAGSRAVANQGGQW